MMPCFIRVDGLGGNGEVGGVRGIDYMGARQYIYCRVESLNKDSADSTSQQCRRRPHRGSSAGFFPDRATRCVSVATDTHVSHLPPVVSPAHGLTLLVAYTHTIQRQSRQQHIAFVRPGCRCGVAARLSACLCTGLATPPQAQTLCADRRRHVLSRK